MDTSRRLFLRGRLSVSDPPVRLPWALDDARFTALCSRCDACISACPQQILVRGDGGFPQLDFQRGDCTFCHACVDVCEQPLFHHRPQPWHAVAGISTACLAQQGVYCQNCKDACAPRAIGFVGGVAGIPQPVVDPSTCTGCGACVAPCPTAAIAIHPEKRHEH